MLADAVTSIGALGALVCGRYFGWVVLDPVAGMVGGALILKWAYGLVRETGYILLDGRAAEALREQIRAAVEHDGASRLVDLRLWNTGNDGLAAILSVDTADLHCIPDIRARVSDMAPFTCLAVDVPANTTSHSDGLAATHL